MATVAIEVQRYKLIYRVAYNALNGLMDDMAKDFMGDLNTSDEQSGHDLPYPDWVCDHCGYANPAGDFEGSVCPRCGRPPITKNQYLELKIQ